MNYHIRSHGLPRGETVVAEMAQEQLMGVRKTPVFVDMSGDGSVSLIHWVREETVVTGVRHVDSGIGKPHSDTELCLSSCRRVIIVHPLGV